MIEEPQCYTRKCIHFEGVKQPTLGEEAGEFVYCKAFPNGIPDDIAYGNNKHLVPIPNQKNEIVFEKV